MWWMFFNIGGAAEPAVACDPDPLIHETLSAWIARDRARADQALARVEATFGCSGPADPQQLGRWWLLQGAWLFVSGEPEAASESLASARRVAPELWLSDLGPDLYALWQGAVASPGTGTIRIRPAVSAETTVWVDGVRGADRPLPTGHHLVQVGDGVRATFASLVWVDADLITEVVLPEGVLLPPVVPPPVLGPEPTPVARWTVGPLVQVQVGAGVARGESRNSGTYTEPSTKVSVPAEVALGAFAGPAFFRAHLGAGWLVDGPYLAAAGDQRVTSPVHVDLGGSAGWAGGPMGAGALVAARWPSRLALRGLVWIAPHGPLSGELRIGANYTTENTWEPSADLLVGWSL